MVRRGLSVCVTQSPRLLLRVSMVQDAQAQGAAAAWDGDAAGASPARPLSAIAAVQKELGLSEDKAAKVKDIAEDVRRGQAAAVRGRGLGSISAGLRICPREEREKAGEIQAKSAEIRKNINDKFMPKINEILDKTQQTRLHEIAIQAAGPPPLEDADVVKDLGLSKDQTGQDRSRSKDFCGKIARPSRGRRRTLAMAKMAELQ